MSSRVRGRVGLAVGLLALLAFAPCAAVWAEDDRSSDEPSQPAGGPDGPSSFVRSAPMSADVDSMVHSGASSERDPRIGVILAAHPDRDVLICLAGCGGGGPKLVAVRNSPAAVVPAVLPAPREMMPASGPIGAPPSGVAGDDAKPSVGDVICIAGCVGAPGEVVQQAIRLTWIGEGASEDLKGALRAVADRLLANEAESRAAQARATLEHAGVGARQAWVSDHARRLLVEPALPAALAALVHSASALVTHGPADRR